MRGTGFRFFVFGFASSVLGLGFGFRFLVLGYSGIVVNPEPERTTKTEEPERKTRTLNKNVEQEPRSKDSKPKTKNVKLTRDRQNETHWRTNPLGMPGPRRRDGYLRISGRRDSAGIRCDAR